jgi:hypothetical protein
MLASLLRRPNRSVSRIGISLMSFAREVADQVGFLRRLLEAGRA